MKKIIFVLSFIVIFNCFTMDYFQYPELENEMDSDEKIQYLFFLIHTIAHKNNSINSCRTSVIELLRNNVMNQKDELISNDFLRKFIIAAEMENYEPTILYLNPCQEMK
ncbi:hypothetical protein M1446_04025 [Candidatus Dependentiae bacterium]|nr:hypothetical protein [Candidatus Dependentiae bacterium]